MLKPYAMCAFMHLKKNYKKVFCLELRYEGVYSTRFHAWHPVCNVLLGALSPPVCAVCSGFMSFGNPFCLFLFLNHSRVELNAQGFFWPRRKSRK